MNERNGKMQSVEILKDGSTLILDWDAYFQAWSADWVTSDLTRWSAYTVTGGRLMVRSYYETK